MRVMLTIVRRELASIFSTPLAYVFLIAFLMAANAGAFLLNGFMDRRQADLIPFFDVHPYLYLVLIPAVGMRLWAEERRFGTVELLMTLPITPWQAVLGKFLAAWLFVGIALALTFPIWITVDYLGSPDHGVIVASYLGSFLMAGALLAVNALVSAMTKSQVVAFVIGVVASFMLIVFGLELVVGWFASWAPSYLTDLIASFSFVTHFRRLTSGVLDVGTIVFFISVTVLFLFVNRQVVDIKKAG